MSAYEDVVDPNFGVIAAGSGEGSLTPEQGITSYDEFNDDVVRAILQKYMMK